MTTAKTCRRDDKLTFSTRRDAQTFLDSLRAAPDFRELVIYRCLRHHGYHIGKRP